MIPGRSACERFSRLASEAEDRDLKPSEQRFMEAHRDECAPCRQVEMSSACALNMLRGMSYSDEDLDISPAFDERIIRKVRLNSVREGLRYWSPAAIGAGIACVALFAALHAATRISRPETASA